MGNSFSRTTRSLKADGHTNTLIGLLVMIVLLIIWGAWFFAAGVPIRLSSTSAQVTDAQRVTAVYPLDSAAEIKRGQAVSFHPAGSVGAQIGAIPGIVSRVTEDPASDVTSVEIALRFEQSLHEPLQEGLKGRVDVELEQISPASLILRSAGMLNQTNGQSTGTADK